MITKKTDDKIDVLQVITALDVGGAERVVLELANGLRVDSNVGVAYLLNQTKLKEQYQDLNIPYFWLGVKRGNILSFIKAIHSLNKTIKQYDIKILHAHMFHSLLISLVVKNIFNKNIKIVFTSHNFEGFSFLRKKIIKNTKKLRNADIVFSQTQHPELIKEKFVIIPNGINIVKSPSRNHKKTPFTFVTVGRLEKQKNHKSLIEAFSKLSETNSQLWIVGDGILRSELTDIIKEKGLESRVILLGIRKDVHKLLNDADCFVLSSLWEGMPMALLEAGMSGIPIITTNVGAIPEVMNSGYGYIGQIESLSSMMEHVINNYEEALAKANNFKLQVNDKFSSEAMIKKHIDLYSNLIENI